MIQAGLIELQLELFLRKREKSEIVWTTKCGDNLPINKMSDKHLINTIKMIQRQQAWEESEFIISELEGLDLNDIC